MTWSEAIFIVFGVLVLVGLLVLLIWAAFEVLIKALARINETRVEELHEAFGESGKSRLDALMEELRKLEKGD